jgi:hypothetical protein
MPITMITSFITSSLHHLLVSYAIVVIEMSYFYDNIPTDMISNT